MSLMGAVTNGLGAAKEGKAAKQDLKNGNIAGAMKHGAAAMQKGMKAYAEAPPFLKKMMMGAVKQKMAKGLAGATA